MVNAGDRNDKASVRSDQLRDEMIPNDAMQGHKGLQGGDEPDTAGQHGEMALESAKGLERRQQGS